ncbi:hypothetical protein BOTBODRAFT_33866 [Botryobasidium botryosum FD-172 SS1]|uniref:Uncharacterized protein n=1 Tax=Botryobasidium botryosum (strain FD-172 SS1) TaxID=930990 RepID=A0A067MM77_BOTB1|nr:hypothetical protein BOTBODRAFT_33866 [Botryobasidium botryosum FD-172 SS1]
MFAATSILLALAASALAAPTPRDVPTENCTSIASGQLATETGEPVSLDDSGKLVYGGSLAVEWQTCTPNFGNYPEEGHIYVPSLSKCLYIASPGEAGPYAVTTGDCSLTNDSSQTFLNFVDQGNGLYWAGITNASGTQVHDPSGTCPAGFYGPSSTATSGPVGLQCSTLSDTVGFQLTNSEASAPA